MQSTKQAYGRVKGQRRKDIFYLTTHSTHFIYGYMASDIWLRTILIVRKKTRCRHMGYSFRLAARVLLYAPSHRQESTHHGLCYTSRGALAGTRNSSMGRRSRCTQICVQYFTKTLNAISDIHYVRRRFAIMWFDFIQFLFSR